MQIVDVLNHYFVGEEWVLRGEDYDGLEWLSESPKPSKKKLEDLISKLEVELEEAANVEATIRASAVAKLQALGLTVDEVQAAFGLNADE